MKIILAAILSLFSCSLCLASELDKTIALLDSDDFDVREAATEELGAYPEEYATKFLEMARETKVPELAYRFALASRLVFQKTIMLRDPRWLKLYGTLEAEGDIRWAYVPNQPENEYQGYNVCGIWVNFVVSGGASEGKIETCDVIVGVNGKPDVNPLVIEAGKEYELTIHRFKDVEKARAEGPYCNGCEFKEIKVKVVAAWKEEKFVDQDSKQTVKDQTWKDFMESVPRK